MSSVEEVERKVASSVSHSPPLSLSRSLSDPFLSKKMSLASQREASMTTKMLGGEEERMEVFFFFCLVVVAE